MSNRKTYSAIWGFIVITILGLDGCSGPVPEILTIVKEDGSIPEREYLDQNWNEVTRKNFWFTSQGSQIIPYKWFVYLERANSVQLFRNVDHMEELRYIPVSSDSTNPGGLPIGFSPDFDQRTGRAWMGFTCAACHTNQLNYEENKILIEGAPTLANFTLFFNELIEALDITLVDTSKFARFAGKLFGENPSEEAKVNLKDEMNNTIITLRERQKINSLPDSIYSKDFLGYARLDAFGQIANQGVVFAINAPADNASISNAPVSYPFLWGTHQSNVVQWNGSAPNTPVIGPLARNMGEVVGVFGNLEIDSVSRTVSRYTSTIQIEALGHLEKWLTDLRSPQWPDNILPKIDSSKALRGKVIYQKNCTSCHMVIDRENESEKYKAVMTPLNSIGTDSTMAWNVQNHMAKTYIMEGKKKSVLFGDKFGPETRALDIAVNGVIGTILEHPIKSFKAGLMAFKEEDRKKLIAKKGLEESMNVEDLKSLLGEYSDSLKLSEKSIDDTLRYKARPLNGIWATAPYLHNGSVPNLWQLLQKPENRDTSFYVGSREFDPKLVGFEITQAKGTTLFRVVKDGKQIPGNSNAGHTYGTDLTDKEKWDLVEYMKTLGSVLKQ